MNYTTLTAYLLGEASGPLTGIYLITNKNTGLRYVGQSVNIKKRWKDHLSGQGNCPKLAASIKKHGPGAFTFEIVELCAPEELNDRELFYISAFGFDSLSPKGYNIGAGGEGVDFTPEVRAKLQEASRRRSGRSEWKKAVNDANRARGDQSIYVLIHIETGAREEGRRWELIERLGVVRENLSGLIHGKRRTHKGYRLAREVS